MPFLTTLAEARDSGRRLLQRPIGYVSGEWARLAPRERRWIAVLAAAVVTVTIVLGVTFSINDIGDLEDANAAIREALGAIAKHRAEYLDAKALNSAQEARIGNDPPQLTADLEAAARAENIQIAESSERPTVPTGRRYLEHDTDVKIRETDLQSLTNFLRRVETGPRLVFLSRLSLKHRFSDDSDKLDVELTATAFERVREDKAKKKAGAAAAEKKE
jgi:type II secretory pathway component PulM